MNYFNNYFRLGRLAALATIVAVSFSACNTDDDETPDQGGTPTPQVYSGYGALVAVKSTTTMTQPIIGDVEIDLGLAVAVFFNGTDYETFVSGGSVTCEGETLDVQSNGSYAYTPSQTNATGIDFSGNPDWAVSGNGDIPNFTHSATRGFPNVGKITSPTTVTRSSGYTLTVQGSISNADSILWIIGGEHLGTTGPMTSRTFTADELSGLQTGTSIIQVAAVNYQSEEKGGKPIWFINEKVVSQTVTVE